MKSRVRIALVQIATLPAYATQRIDHLREPTPPFVDLLPEKGIFAPLRNAAGVASLASALQEAHFSDLREKLRAIVSFLAPLRPHLVVLPEYSIPAALLPCVRAASRELGATIVAGTHTVLSAHVPHYQAVGLDALASGISESTRMAVAPVFFADGSVVFRFKSHRSKWEADLVLPKTPDGAPITLRGDGFDLSCDLRICIDALAAPGPVTGAQLVAVTSWSPRTDPFEHLFGGAVLREAAGVLCNTALVGGSGVFGGGPTNGTRTDFLTVAEAEEAVIVADLDLDRQFEVRGSAMSRLGVEVVTAAPILYASVPTHVERAERLVALRAPATRAQALAQLRELRVGGLLGRHVEHVGAAFDTGGCTTDDIAFASHRVLVPEPALPFWNRCAQGLDDARRLITELLQNESAPDAVVQALPSVEKSRKAVKKFVSVLAREPPTLVDSERERTAPFVNRENEQSRLRAALKAGAVVVLEGLPGIGKKTLARSVAREVVGGRRALELQATAGMRAQKLAEEIAEMFGHSLAALQSLGPDARKGITGAVIVRDADVALHSMTDLAPLERLFALLDGTGCKVMLLASRHVSAFSALPRVEVRRLSVEHFERVFDYWTRVEGVEAEPRVARRLHGYPLAAKFAARLLREGRTRGLQNVAFIDDLRAELVRELLRDMPISGPERRAIEALSVLRRPAEEALIDLLDVPEIATTIGALEERFLVEREDGRVFVMPLVREFAETEWVRKGAASKPHHTAAAAFYQARAKNAAPAQRFECIEEATYHYIALGDYKRARECATDWMGVAVAARDDHWRRRAYAACVDVCRAILKERGDHHETLGRLALCEAKLARWSDAEATLKRLEKVGPPPPSVIVG